MTERLRLDLHIDALRGADPARRYLAAMLVRAADLVDARAGLVHAYDDQGRVSSPAVVKPSADFSHATAVRLWREVFESGAAATAVTASPVERLGAAKLVGTEELRGDGPAPSAYWAYNLSLGVVSQLVLVFRNRHRVIGALVVSRMDPQGPFTLGDRKRLLALHTVFEAGFVLAEQSANIADRARGYYGALLSAREEEVARLVASGATNQQIADALVITEATVKAHLHRIFRKVGVRSRTGLARLARNGISASAPPRTTKV